MSSCSHAAADLCHSSSPPHRTPAQDFRRRFRGFPKFSTLPALTDNAGMRQEENNSFQRHRALPKAGFWVLPCRNPAAEDAAGWQTRRRAGRASTRHPGLWGVRARRAPAPASPQTGAIKQSERYKTPLQSSDPAGLCAGNGGDSATGWRGRRSPLLQDTPCKGASPHCPHEGSPADIQLPRNTFWDPVLQRDPQQGPAHSKELSHSSSAGKVQGRRRRCGDAWLCPGLGARVGVPQLQGTPEAREWWLLLSWCDVGPLFSASALSLAPTLVDQAICISEASWKPHYFWTRVPALAALYIAPWAN